MKRILLILLLDLFFPALICEADVSVLTSTPETQILPDVLRKKSLQSFQVLDIPTIKIKNIQNNKTYLWQKEGNNLYIYWTAHRRSVLNPLNNSAAPKKHDYSNFLSFNTPDDVVNRNFLSLTKLPDNRQRDSIRFIFLMNKGKISFDKLKKINPLLTTDNAPPRMHLLWTGPKKFIQNQKMLTDGSAVDVSIANFEEGYASGEWNVVLPNKKPREVEVALKWVF